MPQPILHRPSSTTSTAVSQADTSTIFHPFYYHPPSSPLSWPAVSFPHTASMIATMLRRLWLLLLSVFGLTRTADSAANQRTSWLIDRPLGNTEKYWLFTPLQRLYCISATVEPAVRGRLTKARLVAAVLDVVSTPAFFNLACTISQPRSESAARWAAPTDSNIVRQLVERSITVLAADDTDAHSTVDRVIERELAIDFDVEDTNVLLWRLVVLPASGSLVWTFQHIVGDGTGARDSLQLLVQRLSEASADERDEPFVRPSLVGAVETVLPPSLTASSYLVAVRRLLSTKPPFFTGRVTEAVPRSAMATRVHIEQLSSPQTARAREKAQSRSITMHGLIVAASAAALRLVFQPAATPCSFLTPINLRPWMRREYQRSVGNLFTAYRELHLCSADDEDDWQFARRYMDRLKQSVLLEYRTQAILSWLGVRLGMASVLAGDVAKLHNLRKGTVEISNLGSVESIPNCAALSFTGRVHNDGPLLLLGPVSVNGRLSLSLSYCTPLVSREDAQQYTREMIRFMTE